jgi:hypothetical protein
MEVFVISAEDQETRSRQISDTFRRYLIALNTGGVAMVFAVAGTMTSSGVNPSWAVWPVAVFVLGLVTTGFSLLLAKFKALKRRDALVERKPEPDFASLLWANATYDFLALVFFIISVGVGLWELSQIQLP